jgi:hypothetical protein
LTKYEPSTWSTTTWKRQDVREEYSKKGTVLVVVDYSDSDFGYHATVNMVITPTVISTA